MRFPRVITAPTFVLGSLLHEEMKVASSRKRFDQWVTVVAPVENPQPHPPGELHSF